MTGRSAVPLLATLALSMGAASLSGCIFLISEPEVPRIRFADAFCASDGFWEIEAEVTHPAGTREVADVWIEVTELYYDRWYDVEVRTYLGDASLDPEGGGVWFTALPSDPRFLDCGWPYDYDIRFFAEDFDGDVDALTIYR